MVISNRSRDEYPFHRPINRRNQWADDPRALRRPNASKPRRRKASRMDWTLASLISLAAVDVALWVEVGQQLATVLSA